MIKKIKNNAFTDYERKEKETDYKQQQQQQQQQQKTQANKTPERT